MPRDTKSSRGSNRGRTGRNNNPQGHNQYDSGWIDSARERPFTAAAAVGGAVAAGVFLWSKRNQISDQISNLSDQVTSWAEGMSSDGSDQLESGSSTSPSSSTGSRSRSPSARMSSSGSSSASRRGKSGRGSGLDAVGVIEVDTLTL